MIRQRALPVRQAAFAGLLGFLLLALAAAPAAAHASLLETVPADGAAVDEPPTEVTLRFNEDVQAPTAGVRVFDSDGERVDSGDPVLTGSDQIGVGLDAGLDDGTYVVTWRALSADGHLVRGAFVFSVGDAGEVDEALVSRLFTGDQSTVFEGLAWLLRVLVYVSVLVVAGAVMWGTFVRSGDPLTSVLIRRGAITGLVASALLVPVAVEVATGLGILQSLRPDVIIDSIGQPGVAAIVRIVALVLLLVVARRGPSRWLLLPAGLALASFLLDGHTRTQDPAWLLLVGDAVHLAAAATWLGGLVVLAGVLRRDRGNDDATAAATDVGRFSRVAAWSSGAVVAAGSAMTWALVRQPRALFSTDYGIALAIKVVIVLVVIVAAVWNNRVLVPSITQRGRGMPMLTRTVRFEAVGLLLVVAVTGALVNIRPASDEAGITGAYQTTVAVTDDVSMDVIVDPNRAGRNEVHLYLVDETGRPVEDVEEVRLRLELPARDIGPIERDPFVAGPGHWQLNGRELSIPGTWEIRVIVRLDRFDERTISVPVVVNP